ncbi:MAG TPA: translation factor GTPase family protein [Gaiellaceae bacterium]|nr:translation factor GTPase family protein [Gaiellaceae bacterium]
MLRRTLLNLGILAHVDAGKTTLTERLLYAAGVVDSPGSVDKGTTRTDSLALEQQRGITIRSAVVAFPIDGVTVNLIDTPGHPDFIAEVERVLGVLDGAVLVVSAVEGVQPQTRILMRALQRLGVPTLLFVNKIDRAGADPERVLDEIERRLSPAVVPMGSAAGLGTRAASFAGFGPADDALAARARTGELYPVYFGSALTGAGAAELLGGIARLLPARAAAGDGPLSARVFKIERDPDGHRIAYTRLFSGTISVRDRFDVGKVTALRVFADGDNVQRDAVHAGEIAKLWGLAEIQVGDWLGEPGRAVEHRFAAPTFESVVEAVDPAEGQRLRLALGQLAEQDPLIDVRQDDTRGEISVSLYGEVQREVIEATLAADYGLEVAFRETTTICIERPTGSGEAVEILNTPTNPFHTDLGLRVEPAAPGSGIELRIAKEVDPRDTPLYIFGTLAGFAEQMAVFVRSALVEGLHGWETTDCVVTVTKIGYSLADGPPSRRGPMPNTRDIKRLVPIVLVQALERAGCAVCEPVFRIAAEVPSAAIGPVLAALGRLGAGAATPVPRGELAVLEALLPASRVQELRRQLPGLTGGEGLLDAELAGYEPVSGEPPVRKRTTPDPRNLEEYLARVGR